MAHNITIAGATYPSVPSIDIPSGNDTASFYATNDANALAKDIREGKTAYTSVGKVTGTMPDNLVTGTFTPGTADSVGSVTIPYGGSGHPIMCAVFPADGSYKSSTDIYNLIQQYAVVEWFMSKANTALAPTYTTSGGANYGCTAWVYKSSTTSATTYSRSSAMTTNTYSSSNPTAAGATCVRFLGNTTLKYYTASTSYGLVSGTTYRYVICYSA